MKTLLALTFAATLTFGMISCGPSAAEKKADSAQLDSTAKGMNNEADSTIAAMNAMNAKADADAKAQQKADSIKKADSIAQAKTKKK